jgi:hypothetical protein
LNILRGTTRQAFFLFLSFGEFVLHCAQWLRYRPPPAVFPDVEAETDLCLQAGSGGETTCRLLSVLDSDLEYLTREESDQIIARFKGIPSSQDKLLFWTGLPRNWAQRWADEHGMLTLTSAMGPLMDIADPQCLKGKKKSKEWSRYVKGASSIFSRYACTCGIIRVLTVPPSETWRLRPNSTFRSIEEPVLKGVIGSAHALRLKYVHLLSGSKNTEYEVWPEDHTQAWLDSYGNDTLNFMLPPATLTTGKKKKKKKKDGEKKLGGSTVKAHPVTETSTSHASYTSSEAPRHDQHDVKSSCGTVQDTKKAWAISRRKQQQIQGSVGTHGDIEKEALSPRRDLFRIATNNSSRAQQAHQANSGVDKKQKKANQLHSEVQISTSRQWTDGINCNKGGNQAMMAILQQPILNVATPPKNKANKKKKRKKKKQRKPERGADKTLETMMKEKANRKAKKKVRPGAKGKAEREANVSRGTI